MIVERTKTGNARPHPGNTNLDRAVEREDIASTMGAEVRDD